MSSATASLDTIFDALGNASRREIVTRLAQGAMTTPEVGRHFGFSKQALSRHVTVLEDAGLVDRVLRGRVHELTIVPGSLEKVASWISRLRRGWESSLERLDEVLGERR